LTFSFFILTPNYRDTKRQNSVARLKSLLKGVVGHGCEAIACCVKMVRAFGQHTRAEFARAVGSVGYVFLTVGAVGRQSSKRYKQQRKHYEGGHTSQSTFLILAGKFDDINYSVHFVSNLLHSILDVRNKKLTMVKMLVIL
jgi:hypothetical protein